MTLRLACVQTTPSPIFSQGRGRLQTGQGSLNTVYSSIYTYENPRIQNSNILWLIECFVARNTNIYFPAKNVVVHLSLTEVNGRDPFNQNFRKFGPKLNGSVLSNRKSFETTGPPFEVAHFSRSDFWMNGSRPMCVKVKRWARHTPRPGALHTPLPGARHQGYDYTNLVPRAFPLNSSGASHPFYI